MPSPWCSFALASGGSPRGRPTPYCLSVTAPDDVPRCSAKGCRAPATWTLSWRNPRIHTADRVKQWLACDEHRGPLADFLARRDFPLEVSPR
jgi:hypothetical protein